jgi:hypothetical protein
VDALIVAGGAQLLHEPSFSMLWFGMSDRVMDQSLNLNDITLSFDFRLTMPGNDYAWK